MRRGGEREKAATTEKKIKKTENTQNLMRKVKETLKCRNVTL